MSKAGETRNNVITVLLMHAIINVNVQCLTAGTTTCTAGFSLITSRYYTEHLFDRLRLEVLCLRICKFHHLISKLFSSLFVISP